MLEADKSHIKNIETEQFYFRKNTELVQELITDPIDVQAINLCGTEHKAIKKVHSPYLIMARVVTVGGLIFGGLSLACMCENGRCNDGRDNVREVENPNGDIEVIIDDVPLENGCTGRTRLFQKDDFTTDTSYEEVCPEK